jgi:tRNA(Ile)-lysidine synthetase-like protein
MKHVSFVITESWRRLEVNKSSEIKRYLTATYERYAKLCINRDSDNLAFYGSDDPDKQHSFNPDVMSILDSRCNTAEFQLLVHSLLSVPEREVRVMDSRSSIGVYDKSAPHGMFIPNKLTHIDHHLVQTMCNFTTRHNLHKERITISLSGGVDSMVCSYLLWVIGQPMQAVHINYNNRAECTLEEDLIKYWCNLLGIPLYIRRLTEINRPKCMEYNMREVYESYTRDMRFYAYTNTAIGGQSYIMLGHNKDDCIENILTNTASQSHYENLCGMTDYSTQYHYGQPLTVLRPLLATMKQDIYTFAEEANIPFLVDSTPKWSQRGKIRDIVRPALESWNPLIIPGMLELSAKMTEMTKLLDILAPKTIPEFESIMLVPKNIMYWEQVFKKQCVGQGLFITQKTMTCWLEKLEYLQKQPNKLILNQPVKFVICKNKIITITKTVLGIKIIIS